MWGVRANAGMNWQLTNAPHKWMPFRIPSPAPVQAVLVELFDCCGDEAYALTTRRTASNYHPFYNKQLLPSHPSHPSNKVRVGSGGRIGWQDRVAGSGDRIGWQDRVAGSGGRIG